MILIYEYGFPEDQYQEIEETLCHHSLKQIISLIKRKGGGNKDLRYYHHFFGKYLPKIYEINVIMDILFWKAYGIICNFVDPFYVGDMELIDLMKNDIPRLMAAKNRSKPNLKYLWKVYQDTASTPSQRDISLPEIKKRGNVTTTELT